MKKLVLIITVLFLTGIIFADNLSMTQFSFEGFLIMEKNKTGKLSDNDLYYRATALYNGLPKYIKSLSNPIVNGYNLSATPYNPTILKGLYYRVKSVTWNEDSYTYIYEIENRGFSDLNVIRWDKVVRLPKESKFALLSNTTVTISITAPMPGYSGKQYIYPEARVILFNSSGWAMFDPMPSKHYYIDKKY